MTSAPSAQATSGPSSRPKMRLAAASGSGRGYPRHHHRCRSQQRIPASALLVYMLACVYVCAVAVGGVLSARKRRRRSRKVHLGVVRSTALSDDGLQINQSSRPASRAIPIASCVSDVGANVFGYRARRSDGGERRRYCVSILRCLHVVSCSVPVRASRLHNAGSAVGRLGKAVSRQGRGLLPLLSCLLKSTSGETSTRGSAGLISRGCWEQLRQGNSSGYGVCS